MKISLDIANISDELYDLLLEEFRRQAELQGVDFTHDHWRVEAHLDEESVDGLLD